jgi:hypothetical protein
MDTSKQALTEQAQQTSAAVLDTLTGFNDQQFNTQPAYGGWTAGQVAEHLLLSGGVTEVVKGSTTPTTNRPPDTHLPMIAGIFLDFNTKLQSPDMIVPHSGYYDKQQQINKMRIVWENVKERISHLDLTVTCLDFEFPTVGPLTRLEWLWFYVWHTQRHLRQLRNIHSAITTASTIPQ